MSEAPYDAMIAYVSLHACCPSKITHFKSSFESSNSGVKMPYPGSFPRLFFFFSNKLRLSTRWNNISVFILSVALGVAVLLAPLSPSAVVFIDRSSESPLLQLSRCCMDTANAASSSTAYLATTGHDWRICSGFSPTWRKYSRLPIRTKIFFVVFFSHWVTPITLIGHEN